MSLISNKNIEGLKKLNTKEIKIIKQNQSNSVCKVAVLNLMPNKVQTEYELLNLLGKCDENLQVYFLKLNSHKYKNISEDYLKENYYTLDELKKEDIDGFIVTGAPIETLNFEDVDYWEELKLIFDFININSKSALFICWGAQAALYHYYKIKKIKKDKKIFGVFKHSINNESHLLQGIQGNFYAPHSRYTGIDKNDLYRAKNVKVISESEEVGEYILEDSKHRFYILGHCEYDKEDLKNEYLRDVCKNLDIHIPENYFKNDNPEEEIIFNWHEDAIKIYSNWIDYLK